MDKLNVKDSVKIFVQKPNEKELVEIVNIDNTSKKENKAEGTEDGK